MLRLIFAFLLVPIISVHAGLVSHWGFEAIGPGDTIADSQDSFNGTISGNASLSPEGVQGNAISFDGDSYVTIDEGIFDSIQGYPFSISCWVRISSQPSGTYAAVWLGNNNASNQYYQVGPRNSFAVAAARNEPECDFYEGLLESSESIDNDMWHHIAAVYTASNGRKLYVDGNEAANGDFDCPFISQLNKVTLGCNARSSGNTDYMTGLLDEVRIFNHALTDIEIKEYYMSDLALGYWSLDSNDGSDDFGRYQGTVSGDLTLVEGVGNSACYFNGSSYINISPDILDEITDYPITISYWFKTSDQGSATHVACWLGKSDVNDRYIQTGIRQGKGMLTVRNPNFDLGLVESASNLDDDVWHHTVAVFNSADDRKLYIDGELDSSSNDSVPFVDGMDKISIGRNSRASATDYMVGSLDELYIYNTALNDVQIKYLNDVVNASVQTVSQATANASEDNWNTSGTWEDGYIPENIYRANFVSSLPLRTPAGDVKFESLMLTIRDYLYIDSQQVTISNLIMDNGIVHVSGQCELDGNIDMAGSMQIVFADSQASLTIKSNINGQGSIRVDEGGEVTLPGHNNQFSGDWLINGIVIAQSDESLGDGNIIVNDGGHIDLGYSLQTASSLTLNEGAVFDLHQDIAVGSLNIKDISFDIGCYDSLYLYQLYDDGTFVHSTSGTGSISVGPVLGVALQSEDTTSVAESLSSSDTFAVILLQNPQSTVKVTVDPQFTVYGNDIQFSGTDTPGSQLSLTFDSTNWGTPQVVSVQAVIDGVVEPEEIATVSLVVKQDGVPIGIIKPLDIIVNDSEPTGLMADFDNNGEVALGDLALVVSDWLQESGYNLAGDLAIKMDDFAVFENQWGKVVKPDSLSDYSSHSVNGNDIIFNCGLSQIKVSMCNSQMARVQLAPDRQYRSESHPDYFMVQKYDWPQVDFTVSDEGSYIKITTEDMVIRAQKSPFRMQMFQGNNETLLVKDADIKGMYREDNTVGVQRVEGPGSGGKFGFGGGDHGRTGSLNKNSGFNQFTVTHGRVPVPFYMSTCGYGIFLNTISKNTSFDSTGGFYTDDYLDYWFMAGPSFKSILGNYSELTGRMNLFPKWAYGFMLSKYGNDNATQDEFIDWINWLRFGGHPDDDGGDGWPIDCYVFDYGWRGAKWNPHKWDEDRYYDLEAMFNTADSLGFHVGLHNNYGTPEAHNGNFKNPEYADEWWQAHRDPVISTGYGDWFWPDEFDVVGDNLMANRSAKVVHERWLEYTTQQRPMFLTRGGFANHHFAGAWSGDIQNTITEMNNQIVNQQAVGLSGYPWFSHDLGGFMKKPSDNLYIRWVAEFGSFCSIMRAHGHDGREPWLYSKNAQGILRKYLKLRYKLFPYIYSSAWQGTSQGIPMMRAMALEYQDNADAWTKQNQYFWGDWFLVAPALSENATDVNVWIPPGQWYDYFNGTKYTGPQDINVRAELDEIPVFVKAGAIIPMGPDIRYADEKPLNEITLDIYPTIGTSSYTLYEDDGVTREYLLNDAYSLTEYEYSNDGDIVRLKINSADVNNPSMYTPALPSEYYCKFNDISFGPSQVFKGESLLIQCSDKMLFGSVDQGWFYDKESHILWVNITDDGTGCVIKFSKSSED